MQDTITRAMTHVTGLPTDDKDTLWEIEANLYGNGHIELWVACNGVRQDVYPKEIAAAAVEAWSRWFTEL